MADKTLSIKIKASGDQAISETERLKNSLDKMRDALQRIGHYGSIAFAGWQISSAARDLALLSESFNGLTSRLKLATRSAEEFAQAQSGILKISKDMGTDFAATGQLFIRSFNAIKASGGTAKEALAVTETVSQALRLGGATAQESASAMLQFSQAMSSGVLRGEELNAVMEASPPMAQALADGLGVPIGQLRKLGEQGVLTSDMIRRALADQADEIKKQNADLPTTMGQGFNALRTSLAQFAASVDGALGITRSIGTVFKLMGEHVKALASVLAGALTLGLIAVARVAYAAAAAFLAMGAAATGATVGVTALSRVMSLFGGPVGIAIAAVVSIGTYLLSLGDKAETAANKVAVQMRRIVEETKKAAVGYKPGALESAKSELSDAEGVLAERKAGIANPDDKRALNVQLFEAKQLVLMLKSKVKAIESAPRTGVQLELAQTSARALLPKDKSAALQSEMDAWRAAAKTAQLSEAEITAGLARIRAAHKNDNKSADAEAKKDAEIAAERMEAIKNGDIDLYLQAIEKENALIFERSALFTKAAASAAEKKAAHNADLADEVAAMRVRNEEIGLTQDQLTALNDTRLAGIITASEEELANRSASGQYTGALEEEIRLLKEKRGLISAGASKEKAATAAKDAADKWKKASDDIERGLSDALMRGFEGGKGWAKNFRDVLKNMFATLVLKPVIEPFAKAGAAFITKGLESIMGSFFAKGGTPGGVSAWRNQIVDKPTFFAFASGGVMGEAGPEAIMPLKRGPDGTLGVRGGGGAVNVSMNFNIDATGADAGAVSRIEAGMRSMMTNFKPMAQQAVREALLRNRAAPGF
jgi:tape measure domain-containing protein